MKGCRGGRRGSATTWAAAWSRLMAHRGSLTCTCATVQIFVNYPAVPCSGASTTGLPADRVSHSYGPTPEQPHVLCFALVWDLNWSGQRADFLSVPLTEDARQPIDPSNSGSFTHPWQGVYNQILGHEYRSKWIQSWSTDTFYISFIRARLLNSRLGLTDGGKHPPPRGFSTSWAADTPFAARKWPITCRISAKYTLH